MAKSLSSQSASKRVQLLGEFAGINKAFGVHSLLHSIATHLLQNGMKLEQIAKFLGHSSLVDILAKLTPSLLILTPLLRSIGC